MSIQEELDSLQPYVIGIRYVSGKPAIDVVLKEGWGVVDDVNITKVKGDEGLNYYMIYSDIQGIGVDELLVYIKKIITLNLDREKKQDLLRIKIDELKILFKENNLDKLNKLKFNFISSDESSKDDIYAMDLEPDKVSMSDKQILAIIEDEVPFTTSQIVLEPEHQQLINDKPFIPENEVVGSLSEEEIEILEEEERGKRNLLAIEARKKNATIKKISTNVELPPKRSVEIPVEDIDYEPDCNCGPNEACEKCMDTKY